MITKKLYIIRHGQTDYNKKGIVQGSGIDSSLNDKGIEQATLFYDKYKHVKFDKIYTSELVRTHQSVAMFLEQGIPHQILSGLNEISWGDKEGEKVSNKPGSTYMELIDSWKKGKLEECIKNGENPKQVQARQKQALQVVLGQKKEENVLICMHGRALRIFLCLLLKINLSEMDQFEHSNLCLYQLDYEGENFKVACVEHQKI